MDFILYVGFYIYLYSAFIQSTLRFAPFTYSHTLIHQWQQAIVQDAGLTIGSSFSVSNSKKQGLKKT